MENESEWEGFVKIQIEETNETFAEVMKHLSTYSPQEAYEILCPLKNFIDLAKYRLLSIQQGNGVIRDVLKNQPPHP